MTEPRPAEVIEVVIGLRDDLNFMNVFDPAKPKRLTMNLTKRSELIFTLSDQLIAAGWKFQQRPIEVRRDFGVNFSSYAWLRHAYDGELAPFTRFKIIYECARLGNYEYSLMMTDSHGQKITLDPDVENGDGHG
ncbi:hypothetical protein [uncultured Caulobacter sp.]|uniref:hypothetical protein n=1 Tax=uncultured Caulobacter sp. TaxID=158749 RepID=UPI0026397362|nr:hypothetical protein [uncultured Caulobacter sp.]